MASFSKKKLDSSTAKTYMKTCNATRCQSPFKEKRNYCRESGLWEIILCHTCSSYGTHMVCSFLESDQIWYCKRCSDNEGIPDKRLSSQNKGMAIRHIGAFSLTKPKASAELSERSTCSIEKCICPYNKNQKYQEEIGSWEILLCSTCGINDTHRLCSFVKCFQPWYCATCQAKPSGNH